MTRYPAPSDDLYAPLEAGVGTLLATLGRDHPAYQEVLVYEHRLRENVAFARTRGDTRDYESGRAEMVAQLNRLSLATLARSFNELCEQTRPSPHHTGGLPGPYRGLFAFREQDAEFFFGREADIERLVAAVQQRTLTAVFGASGSGKSSLMFAGLVPRVRRERGWLMAHFRPTSRPFAALAGALVPLLEPQMSETDHLVEVRKQATALREGVLEVRDVVERILAKHPDAHRLLLILDQGEEIYTLCEDADLRTQFLDLLLAACEAAPHQTHPLALVLVMRADFLSQTLSYRPLADVLHENDVKIGPMTREELAQAITKPAERLGVTFADGLVERMLDDVGGEPGNLPLLEFALDLLWQRGELTHAMYEAIGGVEGALANHAEQAYQKLQQDAAQVRRVVVQLVQPGEGTEDTRRLATADDLPQTDWDLVARLADARLVVTGHDSEGRETVEVVHEALIRRWQTLREWMSEDRAFRTWQERLRFALRQWESSGKDEGALLRGAPLAEAEGWLTERGGEVSEREQAYIETGVALREREREEREAARQRELEQQQKLVEAEQARTRLLRFAIGGVSLVALVAVVAAIIAGWQWWRAEQQASEARNQLLVSDAQAALLGQNPDEALTLSLAAVLDDRENVRDQVTLSQAAYAPGTLRRFIGHTSGVNTVEISPDGRYILSGSWDHTLRLWDAENGRELQSLNDQNNGILSAAFSSDGQTVLFGATNGEVRLWDITSGEEVGRFTGHEDWVWSVVFSPDGQTALSGSTDDTVRLWNIESGKELQRFVGHTDDVRCVAFSPNGQTILSGSEDRTLRLWNVVSGTEVWRITAHSSAVSSVAFDSSGVYVLSGSWDTTMSLWEVSSGNKVGTFVGHTGAVTSVAFSPDSQYVLSSSEDGTLRLWRVHPTAELYRFYGHSRTVEDVAFHPDGQTVISASADGTLRLWNLSYGAETLPQKISTGWIESVAFSPLTFRGCSHRFPFLPISPDIV